MTQLLWANNISSTLAVAISNVATTMTVAAGTGSSFPAITTGTAFKATLSPASGSTPSPEIVLVTAVSTDTFTIARAQEGTTASAWGIGSVVMNLLTKQTMASFGQIVPYPGNPNGNVAGVQGASGIIPSAVWDYSDNLFWICTLTGPASTAQWSAIAPLNSPTFTGTPAVPTAAAGTNTTQAASTAFVETALSTQPQFFAQETPGSYTYTTPSGAKYLRVRMVGGGGAGGGATSAIWCGGGGGAGGYTEVYIQNPGTSYSLVVGTGGTAVAGASGGGGGTTSFGTATATFGSGGAGGVSGVSGGAPGSAGGSGYFFGSQGGYGNDGTSVSTNNVFGNTGMGGASFFGGGGRCAVGTGVTGAAWGSGGGGAYNSSSGAGGNGAGGVVIVEAFFI